MQINKWDVWLAEVNFEDAPDVGKIRPVLVVGHQEIFVLSYTMTGTQRNQDYKVQNLESAGLSKPTYIRVNKKNKSVSAKYIKQLGVLDPIDIDSFVARLKDSVKIGT